MFSPLHSRVQGRVSFTDVSFAYPSRPEMNVLDKFTLEVEPGKVLAIVGGSGTGKSTIGSLLCRLYDPTNGSIAIDGARPAVCECVRVMTHGLTCVFGTAGRLAGVDIRKLNPSWVRGAIGVVSQVGFLGDGLACTERSRVTRNSCVCV